MNLSRKNLPLISQQRVTSPEERIFSLPEKVLQFGTGVLLRGLIDYFIDKANKQGIFNGRVVVVKSTDQGGADAFAEQDNLYTVCIQGIDEGVKINDRIINAAISRVLSAKSQWNDILDCAGNADLKIIISNTTEVGIRLDAEDDVFATPPASFPGKLISFLHARYIAFDGSTESGMVIIPTELLPGNGDLLRSICLELARVKKMPPGFIDWLSNANEFCNSLVDRIVPGKLPEKEKQLVEQEVGYTDQLMIMAEPYRLWAISTANENTRQLLSFSLAEEGVIIAPDIHKYRELKLRLLNGSHTFTCGLAVLCGFVTVREAMANHSFNAFISRLLGNELVPAVTSRDITLPEATDFAQKVLDRYRNPFIDHQWMSITLQYTSKMKMRNIPLLVKHYEQHNTVPALMPIGFAAYLLFMKGDGVYVPNAKASYITDDREQELRAHWTKQPLENVVIAVLSDSSLWGTNLADLPGFPDAVAKNLNGLMHHGAMELIQDSNL